MFLNSFLMSPSIIPTLWIYKVLPPKESQVHDLFSAFQIPNHPLATLVRDSEITEGDFFFLIGRSAVAEAMAGQAMIRKKAQPFGLTPSFLTD
jgi:hypothetical protein